MLIHKKRTWFVIADGSHARVLLRTAPNAALEPALAEEMFDPVEHSFARDLGDDRPGRSFDSPGGGGARHAMEPRSDPHVLRKQAFARHVAAVINGAAERNEFDALVLVAPPKTLGEIRAALGEPAKRRVVAESPKELIKTPQAELAGHLDGILAG